MKQLTKAEAAQLLGCTERQIQRYTQSGKLTVEYVQQGRTRKAVFNADEVRALKQQIAAPELRAIAVRPTTDDRRPMDTTTTDTLTPDTRHLSPVTLPAVAQQVMQMLGATSGIEAGKCVSVEEMKFDRLVVGADGSTRMSGVSVSRYSARA